MSACTPVIHLGGTSAEDLFEQYRNAGAALRDAMAAVTKAAPHTRDHYPFTDGPRRAHDEFVNRMEILQSMEAEFEALMEHVAPHLK